MNVNISKSEMRLLGYLHEHAAGCGEIFPFIPKEVCTALGITPGQLDKDLSFLAQYKLADGKAIGIETMNSRPGLHTLQNLWLLGNGENLMRKMESDLEDQLMKAPDYSPSIRAKITMKAAGFLMDTARDIVVQIVSKSITG